MKRDLPPGRNLPHPDHPGPPPGRPQPVSVGSPAAVLAVVPHLLGFVPSKSLIVIGAGPPRGRIHMTLRFDLPDPPDPAAARDIAQHAVAVLTSQRQAMAVVIGYGPGHLVTPIADLIRDEARQARLDLRDVLRVQDGRYWSYLCREPSCCPPEGVPVNPRHPAATALDAAGVPVLPDRAALAASIAPLGGITRQSMRQATGRAEEHAAHLLSLGSRSGRPRAVTRLVVLEGLSAVADALRTYRDGGRFATDDQVAWLSLALTNLRVRDDAWARMDPDHREAHARLWTDIVRRAEARTCRPRRLAAGLHRLARRQRCAGQRRPGPCPGGRPRLLDGAAAPGHDRRRYAAVHGPAADDAGGGRGQLRRRR